MFIGNCDGCGGHCIEYGIVRNVLHLLNDWPTSHPGDDRWRIAHLYEIQPSVEARLMQRCRTHDVEVVVVLDHPSGFGASFHHLFDVNQVAGSNDRRTRLRSTQFAAGRRQACGCHRSIDAGGQGAIGRQRHVSRIALVAAPSNLRPTRRCDRSMSDRITGVVCQLTSTCLVDSATRINYAFTAATMRAKNAASTFGPIRVVYIMRNAQLIPVG